MQEVDMQVNSKPGTERMRDRVVLRKLVKSSFLFSALFGLTIMSFLEGAFAASDSQGSSSKRPARRADLPDYGGDSEDSFSAEALLPIASSRRGGAGLTDEGEELPFAAEITRLEVQVSKTRNYGFTGLTSEVEELLVKCAAASPTQKLGVVERFLVRKAERAWNDEEITAIASEKRLVEWVQGGLSPAAAFDVLVAMADRGSGYAGFLVGNLLEEGPEGVPQDLDRALRFYKRAVKNGCYGAMRKLANGFDEGLESWEAQHYLDMAIRQAAVEAGGSLVVEYGWDLEDVKKLLNLARLGTMDYRDHDTWREYYVNPTRARELDSLLSRLFNEESPVSPAVAYPLCNLAAGQQGSGYAMFKTAELLEAGAEGVPHDPSLAWQLYKRAAKERKHVGSLLKLADLYERGAVGESSDLQKAYGYLERAARLGHVESMIKVGDYLMAKGGKKNVQKAVDFYRWAVRRGASGVSETLEQAEVRLEELSRCSIQ